MEEHLLMTNSKKMSIKELINPKALIGTILTFAVPSGIIWLAVKYTIVAKALGYGALGFLCISLFLFVYMLWDDGLKD